MKFIKNHKILIAIILVLLIMLSAVGILIFKLSGSNDSNSRLKDIENHVVEKSQISDLKKGIKELENVLDVSYDLKPSKLINVIIEIDDVMEVETAKEYGNKVLEYFDDDQKKYYDIEILIDSNNKESEKYPIVGYKSKTSEGLVW